LDSIIYTHNHPRCRISARREAYRFEA